MRHRITTFALLLLAVIAAAFVAGCGNDEHETEVSEAEVLRLGDLEFDVQITRFLNPYSEEDSAYLEGAPPLEDGEQYLGVFMQINNVGDEDSEVPYPFTIIDTRENEYPQVRIDNDFALEPGTPIPADGTVPGLDTPAREGPIEGSLILFPIEEISTENRPLKLEVNYDGESGEVELDL